MESEKALLNVSKIVYPRKMRDIGKRDEYLANIKLGENVWSNTISTHKLDIYLLR